MEQMAHPVLIAALHLRSGRRQPLQKEALHVLLKELLPGCQVQTPAGQGSSHSSGPSE